MAKGRKSMNRSKDEILVMLSLRIPPDLEKQLKEYASQHRQSVTEVVIDGIRMRLETPADPRDIILSDDNTVRQELQEMIRAEVQAEIGKLNTFMGSAFNVLKLAPTEPVSEQKYDSNTVLQDIEEPEQDASSMPAPQPETPMPMVKTTPELSEDIVKVAEVRRQYPDISERAFIQMLFDQGIYRHRAKDGSEVPLPHSTYRDWIKRAWEADLL